MHTCICNDITCILYLHSYTYIRNVINTSKYIHMYVQQKMLDHILSIKKANCNNFGAHYHRISKQNDMKSNKLQ